MQDKFEDLKKAGVTVVGVSFDDVATQKKFKDKNSLEYDLIADTEGKVVKAFGVPARGKFCARQAYLIRDGKIAWRDTKGATSKQGEDALRALKETAKKKDA